MQMSMLHPVFVTPNSSFGRVDLHPFDSCLPIHHKLEHMGVGGDGRVEQQASGGVWQHDRLVSGRIAGQHGPLLGGRIAQDVIGRLRSSGLPAAAEEEAIAAAHDVEALTLGQEGEGGVDEGTTVPPRGVAKVAS